MTKSGKAGVNAVHLQDDASPEALTVSPAGSRMLPAAASASSINHSISIYHHCLKKLA